MTRMLFGIEHVPSSVLILLLVLVLLLITFTATTTSTIIVTTHSFVLPTAILTPKSVSVFYNNRYQKRHHHNQPLLLLSMISNNAYNNNHNNDHYYYDTKNIKLKRKKRLIWIIDDEEAILKAVGNYVHSSGYQIQTFTNASIPLSLLLQPSTTSRSENMRHSTNEDISLPDAIVCDILMPTMTGYQFLQILRSKTSTMLTTITTTPLATTSLSNDSKKYYHYYSKLNKIPFIFLTAKSTVDDRIKGYKSGADGYLMKPFDPDELIVLLDRLIDRREFLDEDCYWDKDDDVMNEIHGKDDNNKNNNNNVDMMMINDNDLDLDALFQHEKKEGISVEELKNDLDEIKYLLRSMSSMNRNYNSGNRSGNQNINGSENEQMIDREMNNILKQLPALSSSSATSTTSTTTPTSSSSSSSINEYYNDNHSSIVEQDQSSSGIIEMTNDEMEVLTLLCEGYMNKEIANELKYSIRWVEGILTKLYRKTNCSNRTELVKWAVSLGYVDL